MVGQNDSHPDPHGSVATVLEIFRGNIIPSGFRRAFRFRSTKSALASEQWVDQSPR